MSDTKSDFESGFYIVELLGHRRLAGHLREAVIAGAGFLRLDIPNADGTPMATQFISPGSVYCLTPTTEEIARKVAAANRPAPVQRWELPAPEKVTEPSARKFFDDHEDPPDSTDDDDYQE